MIPEGYRPQNLIYVEGTNAFATHNVKVGINTNGEILLSNCSMPANEYIHFNVSYICE